MNDTLLNIVGKIDNATVDVYDTVLAKDALYENADHMAKYDWDLTLAASHALGARARQIASDNTETLISNFFNGQLEWLSVELLIKEMADAANYERNNQLMVAFINGFLNKG